MAQVYMYDYTLKPLAELVCRTQRSWVLNRPDEALGAATLWLSINDPNLGDGLLRFGNILYIHDGILPDWAGVVGEPQVFTQAEVAIRATAAEILFDDRRLDDMRRMDGAPGALFSQVVRLANEPAPLGIALGGAEEGGRTVTFKPGARSLLGVIQDVQARYGGDWGVAPSLGEGRLPTLSAWYSLRCGADYSASVALIEGVNISFADGPIMTRYGRVKNDVAVIGAGGKQDTALRATASDLPSIDAYGLRQLAVVENLQSQASVDARAAQEVEARRQPSRRFEVSADNPDLYPYLGIGNTLGLELVSVGFQDGRRGIRTSVRVIGMAADDREGEIPLVLEEVA